MLLVVDDQPSASLVLQKLFERAGIATECQTNGDGALAFMKNTKPALVILDYTMPGKNGLDVFKEMRADPNLADIPVLFFSAVENGAKREALGLGAAGWLTKGSVGWVELLTKVLELH
jgi:two-component system sensor histidine kinase/response regulator